MKFWQFLRFTHPTQLAPLARIVEEAGFHGLMLADHVVFPEKIDSEYPYDPSGSPFWDPETPWPDPWCGIAAMAAVTTRIHFSTNIFVLPMHNPIEVARSLATISSLSEGRIVLGCGAGWMKEEFNAMNVEFKSRGKRYDEMLEVMKLLWSGGMVEYHGEIFDFPRLQMSPKPHGPIPVFMGGGAKVAMRRAAQAGDGWIAGNFNLDTLPGMIETVKSMRGEAGLSDAPFRIVAPSYAARIESYQRLEEMGVTDIVNLPRIEEIGPQATREQKADYIKGFAEKYLHHFS